ncbi:hypothetical protein GOP47_0016540 [Adiantum capillus-veneris]|uniref:Uncharacterized protein n=1 Tax=Adiantum capillus-veneris TaxID=13818 RepID=A0A9D4UHW6_ADICA|nr:hypothetical protein GOP47_0016540 [Adiantum capillus-veneris]
MGVGWVLSGGEALVGQPLCSLLTSPNPTFLELQCQGSHPGCAALHHGHDVRVELSSGRSSLQRLLSDDREQAKLIRRDAVFGLPAVMPWRLVSR